MSDRAREERKYEREKKSMRDPVSREGGTEKRCVSWRQPDGEERHAISTPSNRTRP